VLGTQVPHVSGLKHTTGEAIYLDDMPNFANEGYLSLVLSTKSHAKILSVDIEEALEMEGVLTYVDWRDLPSEKANAWGTAAIDEFFFAKDEVTCHGQIIGAIVAKTKLQAQRAARKVKVEYEDLPLILTIEEALEADSFHVMYDRRIACGKPTKEALAESENTLSGMLRLGGQEHFYLETMAALAVPKLESGEMECFSSTQDPSGTQRWVAQATGVPRNRIVAKSKRLGGGFGGKESRTAMVGPIPFFDDFVASLADPASHPPRLLSPARSRRRSSVGRSAACSNATKTSRLRGSGTRSWSTGASASPTRANSRHSTPTCMLMEDTRSTSPGTRWFLLFTWAHKTLTAPCALKRCRRPCARSRRECVLYPERRCPREDLQNAHCLQHCVPSRLFLPPFPRRLAGLTTSV
jgi:hypothetical protein